MTAEQNNSDPWPYLMIDRAVEPAVSLLSTRLGITPQHARGGLVGFWGNCADPRDLEKLHAEGKGEVVFSGDEVTMRFALAMAVDRSKVDPEELAAMRLLERRTDGSYRVRGMSRYFKPLTKRLQFRAAATAGGKTRSTAARGPDGRFLPVTVAGPSAGVSAGPSAGVSAGPSAGVPSPIIQPSVQPSATTAVSGQRSSEKTTSVARARPGPEDVVFTHWQVTAKHGTARFGDKRKRAVKARLGEGYTVEQLKQAVDGCLRTPHNMGKNDTGEVYDDLELICRDSSHVDRFMRNAVAPPVGVGGDAATGPKVLVIR